MRPIVTERAMSAEDFCAFLSEMKSAGRATYDMEVAAMLGRTNDAVVRFKKQGADKTIALACAAVLAGLDAYSVKGRRAAKARAAKEAKEAAAKESLKEAINA
jgi:hypothetical protein